MINKRLVNLAPESKKYIAGNVILQWCALAANIVMMTAIADFLALLFGGAEFKAALPGISKAVIAAAAVRFICTVCSSRMGYLSSRIVKKKVRSLIYDKLLRLGADYKEKARTSEVVQVAVEGADQLETYFGAYLPQLFYAMLAPLTLFIVLCFVNIPSAVILAVCVPLIPISIAAVQTWAKKLFSKYWGQYTELGDTFLENLQGLTTLKIYKADEFKNIQMNEKAEEFRRITMKVLIMQLNSITIMDLIAYGGAAGGIIMAANQFLNGNVTLEGCFLIILLGADFFIPMRQLGSFFHIAMNGMAASGKIFNILDIPEDSRAGKRVSARGCSIECKGLCFSYEAEREILHGIDMILPERRFTAIVGESGSGKSTIASIIMGRNKGYSGSVSIGGVEIRDADEESLFRTATYVSHQSYLFKGTVRDNLKMAKPDAPDDELWAMLARVKLADFLRSEQGLDTQLLEKAANLSGGQCQRLALARALLHDSPVYIFDEATSNIDMESEEDIMREIQALAKRKTVILISHRLANVTDAGNIYVMDGGIIAESGSHEELLEKHGLYEKLWRTQSELENYGRRETPA